MSGAVVQLPLALSDANHAIVASSRFRDVVREVAEEVGIKVLAERWGCSESHVSDKLAGRGRLDIKPAEWMRLMLEDPRLRILGALNQLAGCEEPERRREFTDAEKYHRLREALEQIGPEIADLAHRLAKIP